MPEHGAHAYGGLFGGALRGAACRADRCGGVALGRAGAAVVDGSTGRVAEDRVRRDDLVDGGVLGLGVADVAQGAGVRVVVAHEGTVGTPDLTLGRLRAQAQDGVQVAAIAGHVCADNSHCRYLAPGCGGTARGESVPGLAWVASWDAVKAWASRTMRLARRHERGPGEGLVEAVAITRSGFAPLRVITSPFVVLPCSRRSEPATWRR